MVVYSIPPSLLQRTSDRNNPHDTSSVGSTIDKSFERKSSKTDLKKSQTESYEEWYVVQSGGEKAKENHTGKQPHPCRYDEYKEYLPPDPGTTKKLHDTVGKESNETTDRTDKEQESSEGDKTMDDEQQETNNSTNKEKPTGKDTGTNDDKDSAENNAKKGEGASNNSGSGNNGGKENNEDGNKDPNFPGFDVNTKQTFTLEFDMRNTAANTVGTIHRAFIEEIFEVAPNTVFEPSNKRTTPTPKNMTTKEQFPTTHLIHQKFFHRLDIRDKVSYTHNIYSSISAIEIKRRVMAFLHEYNIGMWSEEISCNTKVRVCWILNAHNRVTNKSEVRRKTIEGINSQSKNYGDENNRLLQQLPKNMKDLEVQSRTINHKGYTTEAVCILAYRPIAPVVRELIAMLPHDYLGSKMSFVSEAAARELDSEKYTALIVANTEFHQNTRTISIKYFHEQYWKVPYKPSELANYTPVREWILAGSSVVSIERTKDTDTEGRYIILCRSDGFPVFRRQLQKMVMKLKETIENDHSLKNTALEVFQQYPTIIGQHHMGKYAEKNAKGLLSRIDVPAVPRPAMKMTSNRIEFNFDSAEDFPGIQNKTSVQSSRRTPTKKQTSWANAVKDKDNNSIASEPSETDRTAHSARTGITTTDQQTMQSEAISVLTDYIQASRKEDAERRKEERREDEIRRKEERAERKADKEERRREEADRKREQEATDRRQETLRKEEREDSERRRKMEASERIKEAERRDEHNLRMFHTMMDTMMRNNTNTTDSRPIHIATNHEEGTDNTGEQNKKRKNENNLTTSKAQELEQEEELEREEKEMEVEETTPTPQNHDVHQGENKTNQH